MCNFKVRPSQLQVTFVSPLSLVSSDHMHMSVVLSIWIREISRGYNPKKGWFFLFYQLSMVNSPLVSARTKRLSASSIFWSLLGLMEVTTLLRAHDCIIPVISSKTEFHSNNYLSIALKFCVPSLSHCSLILGVGWLYRCHTYRCVLGLFHQYFDQFSLLHTKKRSLAD